MTTSILHYFVDTNLFIQCQPLNQLDWCPWDTFEEVRLIVSSPVLREIDNLKNKGRRAGRRARATSAMFRKMLNKRHKLVRTGSPRVVLAVEPDHHYPKDLEDRLDYQERDDQLVGIAYDFAQRNGTLDVRLLTHDTTPLYTARGLNLTADLIPDEWLLPPETTKVEKELTVLRDENARLKKAGPSFTIRCIDKSDSEVERYWGSYTWFEPLTDEQIDGLVQRLKDFFPLETDFGSREPAERAVKQSSIYTLQGLGAIETFTPATDKEIAKYSEESYPQWLKDCEQLLRNHHRSLQRQTRALGFSFGAENVGTRPAADALVTIEAEGNFWIQPPQSDGEGEEQDGRDDDVVNLLPPVLPRPPVAPSGRWTRTVRGYHVGDALRSIDSFTRSMHRYRDVNPSIGNILNIRSLHDLNPPRDRNAFYFKPDRPELPQSAFSLECDQWRHDDEEKDFSGEIHVPTDQDVAEGALVCRIQASNLSKSKLKRIPVEIQIDCISAYKSAQDMVQALLKRPKIQIRPSSEHSGTRE